ncbi:PTS system IIA component, Glc family [Alteribacillus persepolensis]|uniref:PTS system IIA component, Glc family n=1 Tax=Alteribacillus persepolensis TaxID=568899 RepID=A0A1G7ZQ02_9BACI|nr:PTS glucose transporter subunit IIA [Alteribacillus persepolensis]SDH10774.1 PTS system IIA component, Glc family [Alteribacillus persepolensis]
MLKKLFGNKQEHKEVNVLTPATGKYVDLRDVPDPTFSEKMMGDGFAVEPSEGKIVSPVQGKVVQVFPTKHAVGIKSEEGLDILVHIGLETVSMNGEGFTEHVKEGDKVNQGDVLIEFSLEDVKSQAKSTVTPVVFTEGDQIENITNKEVQDVTAGETEMCTVTVVSKK